MNQLLEVLSTLQAALTGPVVLDQVVKATILLAIAWGASLLLRRASSAARHLTWLSFLIAVLILPLLSGGLPGWRVPIFDASMATSAGSSGVNSTLRPAPVLGPQQLASNVAGTSRPPSPKPAASAMLEPWRLLLAVWATGTLLLLLRLLLSTVAAWWVVHKSIPVADEELVTEVEALRRQLGVRGAIALVENPRVSVPMAWGLLRHTILLPPAARSWSPARRRVVLLHELAHLARRDCLTLMLARLATALHWFNPLAWLALRRLQAERERACDDLVLTAGTAGVDYADHLLGVARTVRASLSPNWAMVAMARPSELEGRLLAILDPSLARARTSRLARLAAVLVVVLLSIPLAVLQPRASAEPPSSSPNAAEAANKSAAEGGPSRRARLIDAFSEALEDPDSQVRAMAAHSLGSIEDAAAVPVLDRLVRNDGSVEVRRQAAWALGSIEAKAGAPALSAALSDSSSAVRQQAAWALGMIESEPAIEPLGALLIGDEEAEVRHQAAWALGMIERPSAVRFLISALQKDSSPEVRRQSAWALGMIEAEAAMDPLLEALTDEDPEVRKQALWAISHISG